MTVSVAPLKSTGNDGPVGISRNSAIIAICSVSDDAIIL